MATETDRKMVPAYVAFKTFLNFVDGFSGEAGLPDHIDKSLMPTMSGGLRNHLMASLKSLYLISDDGTTSMEFRELVKARGTDGWKECLRHLIDIAYKGIVDSSVVSKLTPKKLQDSFRDAGATGSTTGRAIRFYLSALKECGIEVPTHLSKASGGTSQSRKKPDGEERPKKTVKRRKPSAGNHPKPEGLEPLRVPFGGVREGFIYYPDDLTEDECDKYDAAISYLRALLK